jgi:hypothetical protein
MECVKFSETREERKYYEDKKQKALRYLDHTIEELAKPNTFFSETDRNYFNKKLKELKKRVNDI